MLDNLSYLAGIIDGEGHVGFHKRNDRPSLRFVIQVKMTSESIIDWLQSNYGGQKKFCPRGAPHWKDQWRWCVTNKKARDIYRKVKPLLKIKNTHIV